MMETMDRSIAAADRAEGYAQNRRQSALWYAFGALDATGVHVDAFAFATFAYTEALAYATEQTVSLDSVQGQWDRWTTNF